MSAKDKVSDAAGSVTRRPVVAHTLRMVAHYGKVQANLHAGAITFFGFLSMFPLLALLFFAVGVVSVVYSDADAQITSTVQDFFPGLIGPRNGQISLDSVRSIGGSPVSVAIGFGTVLFTGLGFILVLRTALMFVFERPIPTESFPVKKLKDLVALVTVGGTLLVSVVLGSVLTRFSAALLGLVGLDDNLSWLLAGLAFVVGFAVNVMLFLVLFRQLGRTAAPNRAILGGALLGAVGFEVVKQVAPVLIASTQGKPAFQAFGIALVLLVVMNYFARLVLYAASWAHTSPGSLAMRPDETAYVQGPQLPAMARWRDEGAPGEDVERAGVLTRWGAPFAAGGATMLAVVAWLRRAR